MALPDGPKDKTILVIERMREWLRFLPSGQRFTYHQARRAIDASWDGVRKSLNKLEEEGWVEYVGHERSRTWKRL
jgi:hypothetical protein